MTVFSNTQDQGIHVSRFYQDRILAGGSSPYFSVLNYNDELHTGIETSSSTLYAYAVTVRNDMNKVFYFFPCDNFFNLKLYSLNFVHRFCA